MRLLLRMILILILILISIICDKKRLSQTVTWGHNESRWVKCDSHAMVLDKIWPKTQTFANGTNKAAWKSGMTMYGKHFESMYTGSMMGSGAMVFAVWGYVLTHQQGNRDRTHFTVELNPKLVGTLIGESKEDIERTINAFCEPDLDSRSQILDGRRLVKLGSYLYEVVNGAFYDKLKREADKREADRIRQEKCRAAGKAEPENEYLPGEEEGKSKANVPRRTFLKPSPEDVKSLAAKIGLTAVEAEKFFAYYESNGWRVGKNKMVDWHKALSGWKLRMEDNNGQFTKGSQSASGSAGRRGFDRNKGTLNEGTTEQYDTAKIQAARELREQQQREAEAAGGGDAVRGQS